ncbi:2-dehydro-3-deoxy-6-phosphogalactonate aldolase [bacterium]|nr:MAG: 2-dehydro-3-deoxy-6-phosphogalactonate aldolase [bacterium]
MKDLRAWLKASPLIAILRGVTPTEVEALTDAIVDAGIVVIEIPLNSPRPFESIERLAQRYGERVLVGAGTVLDPGDVARVAEAGGKVIVMPHAAAAVVKEAKARGLIAVPGCATPTEAFCMLAAGADALKLFPAEAFTPAVLRALLAVLPAHSDVLPVGGIVPEAVEAWLAAGAAGFGIGSALFRPGIGAVEVSRRAQRFVSAVRQARTASSR